MKRNLLLMMLIASMTAMANVPLKIVRGEQDTVYRAKHNIVAVTEPGNTAKIGGEQVKVYKTGAFGKQVVLKPGQNVIEVVVENGKKTARKKMQVFLSAAPASKPQSAELVAEKLAEPQYFETTDGAYLQYGDGGDRLGGSKMGYLSPGIVLKAVESKGDLYKVELSQNRYAYISNEYLLPTSRAVKTLNTGSWSISNQGKYDRVSISLPDRLPYRSWTQLDPTTICVEIFGAMNNSNWITQRGDLGMIEYVDWRQTDSDVLCAVIKLKSAYSWGYSVSYQDNNLVIDVKHTPSLKLNGLKVGLDAGHGGEYPGAKSAIGLTEKEINLDMVMRLKELLEAEGAQVILTRDDDSDISMSDRKKVFADAGVDIAISIHNNSGGSPFAEMGTSTYYKHISNRALASCMLGRLLELGVRDFGMTGNFNFSLNAPTEYPNVLLEVLFMSSLPEEELLADPEFRQSVAEKALLGLKDYLSKVAESEESADAR